MLVIIDLMLNGADGIDVLIEMRKSVPDLRAIILTGHNEKTLDVGSAVASLQAGALDYITKAPPAILSLKLKEAINKHKRTKLIKVFLSYEKTDIKKVSSLRSRLTIQGFLPWMDEYEFEPGKWKPRIEKAIRDSDYFIACLSLNLINKTGFVNAEIEIALDKQREFGDRGYIIPVLLVDCEIPDSLKDFHAVYLFKKGEFDKLVKMLNSKK